MFFRKSGDGWEGDERGYEQYLNSIHSFLPRNVQALRRHDFHDKGIDWITFHGDHRLEIDMSPEILVFSNIYGWKISMPPLFRNVWFLDESCWLIEELFYKKEKNHCGIHIITDTTELSFEFSDVFWFNRKEWETNCYFSQRYIQEVSLPNYFIRLENHKFFQSRPLISGIRHHDARIEFSFSDGSILSFFGVEEYSFPIESVVPYPDPYYQEPCWQEYFSNKSWDFEGQYLWLDHKLQRHDSSKYALTIVFSENNLDIAFEYAAFCPPNTSRWLKLV